MDAVFYILEKLMEIEIFDVILNGLIYVALGVVAVMFVKALFNLFS